MKSVIYQFIFNFGTNYYAEISLGASNDLNIEQINFYLPKGFLKPSEESHSPMYVKYIERLDGSSTSYELEYGINDIGSIEWNEKFFIIYNEEELLTKYGSFTKSINDGYPLIVFDTVPGEAFTIIYGTRSTYELGYGFQKIGEPYSDSVRLIYNSDNDLGTIITNINGPTQELNATQLQDPSLFIGLDNSNVETVLELYNIPLLYAPEVNITFILDPIIINQIKSFSDGNDLHITFYYHD